MTLYKTPKALLYILLRQITQNDDLGTKVAKYREALKIKWQGFRNVSKGIRSRALFRIRLLYQCHSNLRLMLGFG